VLGLDLFGIKLADAAKKFGKKFACGASVIKDQGSNKEQIDVQGDCMDEMAEFICKEWKDVTLDDIKCVDKDKK
jgi:density-regulated protein DRP1